MQLRCGSLLVLGIGQEITIGYRNTLADWLLIIQSKTIFTLQKTVFSIQNKLVTCAHGHALVPLSL